jgi:tryptophan synthase alpha chain
LDVNAVQQKVNSLRDYAELPLYVGFGIRDGETAGTIAAIADGVVVGSAIVTLLADAEEKGSESVVQDVLNLTTEIRAALDASVS